VKKCVAVLVPFLTLIINLSLSESVVPEELKLALIVPILKKIGLDLEVLNNYRPVSILSFLSKLLERVVLSQLLDHLSLNDLFELYQSSYKKWHSTETALVQVHDNILRALDENDGVILILLDQSAAFDTVDHRILLNRLERKYGIRNGALQWFHSYLENRSQVVVLDGSYSEKADLQYGVPQGSILGPVLFTLYTQPLVEIFLRRGINYHLYADDIQFYLTFNLNEHCNSFPAAQREVEDCIYEVQSWLSSNFLKLNNDKTEILILRTNKHDSITDLNVPFDLGGCNITCKEVVKNIGCFMDCRLGMESHINNVARTCFMCIRQLYKVKKYVPPQSLKKLVHALVINRVDYLNGLYGGLPLGTTARLQRCLNSAARLISGKNRRESVTPVLKDLHWLPVKYRIQFKLLVLIHKVVKHKSPMYLLNSLTLYSPTRDLRSLNDVTFVVDEVRYKKYGGRRFSVYGAKLWNDLPRYIRTISSTVTFRKKLKTLLYQKAFT